MNYILLEARGVTPIFFSRTHRPVRRELRRLPQLQVLLPLPLLARDGGAPHDCRQPRRRLPHHFTSGEFSVSVCGGTVFICMSL